nr:hypothetical protein [uncultured Desulfobulbus sp.]
MDHSLKNMLSPKNLEYLTLDQAASICCVSTQRFGKWIEQGLIPVIDTEENRLIRACDLIQHLIRHNIRIPERLLPGNSKKILFILLDKDLPGPMANNLIWTLYRLRQHPSFIVDFIEYDSTTELKVITFGPDIIYLLKGNGDAQTFVQKLHQMLTREIPIHRFPLDQAINFNTLLNL